MFLRSLSSNNFDRHFENYFGSCLQGGLKRLKYPFVDYVLLIEGEIFLSLETFIEVE